MHGFHASPLCEYVEIIGTSRQSRFPFIPVRRTASGLQATAKEPLPRLADQQRNPLPASRRSRSTQRDVYSASAPRLGKGSRVAPVLRCPCPRQHLRNEVLMPRVLGTPQPARHPGTKRGSPVLARIHPRLPFTAFGSRHVLIDPPLPPSGEPGRLPIRC